MPRLSRTLLFCCQVTHLQAGSFLAMSASTDSEATRSPSPDLSIVGNLNRSTSSGVTHSQVANFIESIRANPMVWSIGDKLGVAYHFTGERLFKQNNVVNRSGVRTRLEIRNLDPFFARLHSQMLQCPFVQVQLCGSAEAHLMYCHSKLVRLEPKRSVLLLGDACFVQGHFNNYFAEPIPIKPGTLVKLYSRAFDIRVSSNRHCIFVRAEDIIKNRIRMEQLNLSGQQVSTEEVEESEDESGDDELDEDFDSFEPDSANEEDHSSDGSRRGGRRNSTVDFRHRGRGRASANTGTGTPQLMPPGAARRARMVNAATQTSPPRPNQARQGAANEEANRDQSR